MNFPLLLHVLGASLLLGALITALSAQVLAWRGRSSADVGPYSRLAFWTLLIVAVPAFVLMRVGAEWIASEQGWNDVSELPLWIDLGYVMGDFGALVLILAIVLTGLGARRLTRSDGARGAGLVNAGMVLSVLLVLAYVVVTWAMSAKPD